MQDEKPVLGWLQPGMGTLSALPPLHLRPTNRRQPPCLLILVLLLAVLLIPAILVIAFKSAGMLLLGWGADGHDSYGEDYGLATRMAAGAGQDTLAGRSADMSSTQGSQHITLNHTSDLVKNHTVVASSRRQWFQRQRREQLSGHLLSSDEQRRSHHQRLIGANSSGHHQDRTRERLRVQRGPHQGRQHQRNGRGAALEEET